MATNDLERLQGGDGSKFNSSIADLERMHNLLLAANRASIYGNVREWLGALKALDRELSPYLNEQEREEIKKVRLGSVPYDERARGAVSDRLERYENELRRFRSKKKLGIIADDDVTTAALR